MPEMGGLGCIGPRAAGGTEAEAVCRAGLERPGRGHQARGTPGVFTEQSIGIRFGLQERLSGRGGKPGGGEPSWETPRCPGETGTWTREAEGSAAPALPEEPGKGESQKERDLGGAGGDGTTRRSRGWERGWNSRVCPGPGGETALVYRVWPGAQHTWINSFNPHRSPTGEEGLFVNCL